MIRYGDLHNDLVKILTVRVYELQNPLKREFQTAKDIMDREQFIFERFRNDPQFHATVERMAAEIMDSVQYHEAVAKYGKRYVDELREGKEINFRIQMAQSDLNVKEFLEHVDHEMSKICVHGCEHKPQRHRIAGNPWTLKKFREDDHED